MPHLKVFEIENFRMFEQFRVEGLARMNLIVGKNNTGKTTLLEALRIWPCNADFFIAIKDACVNRDYSENNINLYPKKKQNHKMRYSVNIKIDEENKQGSVVVEEDGYAGTLTNINDLPSMRKTNSFVSSTIVSNEKLLEKWNDVYLTPEEDLIIEGLKIIEPRVRKFGIKSDTKIPEVLIDGDKSPMPIRAMGEGMGRVLQIIMSTLQAKNGLLLIDEFENGLHYSIQEKIWKLLLEFSEKHNIQIFATTHSLDTVNSFRNVVLEQEEIDTGAIIRLGHSRLKANLGQIISTVYNQESLQKIEDMDLDIR